MQPQLSPARNTGHDTDHGPAGARQWGHDGPMWCRPVAGRPCSHRLAGGAPALRSDRVMGCSNRVGVFAPGRPRGPGEAVPAGALRLLDVIATAERARVQRPVFAPAASLPSEGSQQLSCRVPPRCSSNRNNVHGRGLARLRLSCAPCLRLPQPPPTRRHGRRFRRVQWCAQQQSVRQGCKGCPAAGPRTGRRGRAAGRGASAPAR